jgi:hypothetical protein
MCGFQENYDCNFKITRRNTTSQINTYGHKMLVAIFKPLLHTLQECIWTWEFSDLWFNTCISYEKGRELTVGYVRDTIQECIWTWEFSDLWFNTCSTPSAFEVETHRIFRQSAHEGGKVVSPKRRPPLPSRNPWYSFLLEAEPTSEP